LGAELLNSSVAFFASISGGSLKFTMAVIIGSSFRR
jgi:hypothetical protein